MKIIKTYTEQNTGEKLYSTILSENEYKLFSKMEDEDYLDDQRDRKKKVKHAKAQGALIGGTVGAGLGGRIGAAVSKNALKGGLIGAGIGAASAGYAGYKLGKAHKKATEEDADREIKKYKNASEADKKYLRARHEKQKERDLQERQARAQEQIAWNSYRYYSDKKNGEETKHQKNERKKLVGNLLTAGTITGGIIGVNKAKFPNSDRANRIGKAAVEDSKKTVDFLTRLNNKYKETGGRFKDQQTADTFEKAFKWGENRVKANTKGIKKAYKVASAMDAKNALKRGAKGAAISAAIMAPIAYAANKGLKNQNEEINRSRRNKKNNN